MEYNKKEDGSSERRGEMITITGDKQKVKLLNTTVYRTPNQRFRDFHLKIHSNKKQNNTYILPTWRGRTNFRKEPLR